MKRTQKKRSGLLPVAAMMAAALVLLGANGGAALAQPAGGGQTADTPLYQTLLMGSPTPLIDVSEDPGWQGLSVSGFINSTTGMWVNSSGVRYQKSKNSLAAERNWLQLDINYILNGDNRFFVRGWVVYEPSYRFEYKGNASGPGIEDMSDYYNQYNVRDAYWKSVMGPLTLFVGRQIVTWGESLAFRIGDVINPQDFTWNFGFSNLEQSRLPLWMVHPIFNLPSWGPLTANFIEGVWTPAWQPMYNPSVDTPNQDLTNPHSNWYDGQHDVAGSVSLLAPFVAYSSSEGRFQVQPYPLLTGAAGQPNNMAAFPQLCGSFVNQHCQSPAFSTFSSPFFGYHLPGNTLGSSTEGFRLHTLVKNAEITMLYWHGHQFNEGGTPGAPAYVVGSPSTGQFIQFGFPQFNDIGVTLNRPIYLPGQFLSSVPIVLRTEAVWQDRTPFNTTDVGVRNAVVDKNTVNSLVALDLDGLYAPWLTKTGVLNANLEWNQFTISGYGKNLVYATYAERWRHNEEQILFSTNTSFWWGAILPTYTMIWNPSGNTTLLFPTVTMTPPWTNKYFATLGYVGILGNDKFNSFAGGVFKGKSLLYMQFQYNFQLIKGRT
jgi:uncharacterized protein DUF1302